MATPFPFTSGQTLTAAQMNAITTLPTSTKTASHTLVIADQGTRVIMNSASATTITVNTSIFGASDVVEIQNIGAGVCTVTAGSCTVSSAGPLAIPQHGGGRLVFSSASASTYFPTAVTATPGGLSLISTTTIGNTVSSVTVSNAFSSTHDNYKIIVSGGVASQTAVCSLILGATTTGYYRFIVSGNYGSDTVNGSAAANAASWSHTVGVSTNSLQGEIDLYLPNAAKTTHFTAKLPLSVTNNSFFQVGGFLDNSTSYTAFTLTPSAGTLTGGTVKVYGYANS